MTGISDVLESGLRVTVCCKLMTGISDVLESGLRMTVL